MNDLCGKNCVSRTEPMCDSCLRPVSEPMDAHLAENFNEYFSSIGANDQKNLLIVNATKLLSFPHSKYLHPLDEKAVASIIG